MIARTRLRELIAGDEPVVVPGTYSALGAKLIERAGFPAVCVSGYGTAAALFGEPDIGVISQSDVVETTARVTRAVGCPVIADADTGYGDVANVWRTVRALERAGVAGLFVEDRIWPMSEEVARRPIRPTDEMVDVIKVAREARTDDALVLIGRTDARASEPLDAVIDRANCYVQAGADVIFVEEPHSLEELQRLPREVNAPLLVNMCEGYKTPMVPAAQLNEMGYRLIIYPISLLLYEVAGAKKVLETLRRDGSTTQLVGEMVTEGEVSEIVGMADAESLYARVYGSPTSVEAAPVGG